MYRNSRRAGIALVVLMLGFASGEADQPPKEKEVESKNPKVMVMQKKLSQSQKLLEGLAIQDFDKMTAAANELAELRKQAAWMVLKTREYEMYSDEFLRRIEAAQQAAKAKNIDAAALAYVDMTLTCVKCHKYVRDQRIALGSIRGANGVSD
jgi:hypothetical protein